MRERPIPFQRAMVLAERAGIKSQTRRALSPQPDQRLDYMPRPVTRVVPIAIEVATGRAVFAARDSFGQPVNAFPAGKDGVRDDIACPYGQTGDRLWAREAWRVPADWDAYPPRLVSPTTVLHYDADGPAPAGYGRARVARFMCRWMSRTVLELTEVRVQRLHDISESDAIAEGIHKPAGSQFWHSNELANLWSPAGGLPGETPQDAYRNLWNRINGDGSWDLNPWVWAVSFRRVKP